MRGTLVLLLTASFSIGFSSLTYSQTGNPQNLSKSSEQWISHQMNQPPPETRDKYVISQEQIEEIKQLYLQAQKELDAKLGVKPSEDK